MKKWDVVNKFKIQNSKFKIEELINLLLTNRGLKKKKDIDPFLKPKLEDITPDSVGIDKKQLTKAIKRIKKAIDEKERIVIYGDYDVDGISGSAILWETLHHNFGAHVTPYIPHRVDEGYGLSIKGIENLKLHLPGVKLIITVDNGIVANEAVDFAESLGIDVIITDHHVALERELKNTPNAYAIVHTTHLCGAGVAWLLSQQFKIQNSKFKIGDDEHLELVALGTIADLVSLTGANRTLVKYGLEKLCQTKRLGLLELFREAGCDRQKLGVYEIGHIIAPRLNASGRMESAMDSLRLLCTKDRRRAKELADKLGKTNRQRQLVMIEAAEHAKLSIQTRKELKKLLVVSHDSYQEGVIGLVAGRLVEEFYRPSIVISKGVKVSKGSVRSIAGFNIIEFLRSASEYFVNVGGHPMAAGFTIETDKIEQLQKHLEHLADGVLTDGHLVRTIRIDCELPFEVINQTLYQKLRVLEPFGMGNPEPTFVSCNITVSDMRILGRDGKHIKLLLTKNGGPMLEAIAFGMGERNNELSIGDTIDVAYTIDLNIWNGSTRLQLKVKDFKKTK